MRQGYSFKQFIKKIDPQIWILLICSVVVWGALLHPAYFFKAHDARHSIFYLVEFDQTWRDGYWWPRWSPDFAFGYGYPLFNIYAPLAIYMAEILHLCGLDMVNAVKSMYILATIGSGLTMYGFVNRLFGKNAGLVAGIVYMVAPFHLVEIYVRSAYAEYVSLMWLPLILWMFTELIAQPSFGRLALAGGSYGLLALTHHTSFFTFTPFLMLYIGVLIIGKARFNLKAWVTLGLFNFGAGVLGLSLAAIYLIPAILEQKYIKVEQWTSGSYDFAQHFVYFSQFLSPFWGYGYAGPGPIDFMPYQIGIIIYSLLAVACLTFMLYAQYIPHKGSILIFLGATFLSIWLMSPLAVFLWRILPIAALVQFPWRLLIIMTLSISVVSGGLVQLLKVEKIGLNSLILITVLGSYNYTLPEYTAIPNWATTSLAVINWDSASITDRVGMVIYTDQQPTTSPMEVEYQMGKPLTVGRVLEGEAKVTTLRHGGASDELLFEGKESTVQFYTYNYPGWQVTLDGRVISHWAEGPYGLITVNVPAGEHTLNLEMKTTVPRVIGATLSVCALLTISVGIWRLLGKVFID